MLVSSTVNEDTIDRSHRDFPDPTRAARSCFMPTGIVSRYAEGSDYRKDNDDKDEELTH